MPDGLAECNRGEVRVQAAKKGLKHFRVASGNFSAQGAKSKKLSLRLTSRARQYFAANDRMRIRVDHLGRDPERLLQLQKRRG